MIRIESGAFQGCSGLISITSFAVAPPRCDSEHEFHDGIDLQNCIVYVPAGSTEAYKQAQGWSVFDHIEQINGEAGEDPVGTKFEVGGIFYRITDQTTKEVEITYETKIYQSTPSYTGNIEVPSSVSYNGVQYSVTAIGMSAFFDCAELTSIILPNSVTTIAPAAFENCTGLSSITLPNALSYIGKNSFFSCSGLTSINLPESLKYLMDGAFQLCSGLTSIELPNTLTEIGECTFAECTSLTSITLPEAITQIKYCTFIKCTSLTSITLPNSLTEIGTFAFSRCTGLTSITSLAVTPPQCSSDAFIDIDTQNCALHVPTESIEAYKQADVWSNFQQINGGAGEAPVGTRFEADGIFYRITNLTPREVEVTYETSPDQSSPSYTGNIEVPSTVSYNEVQYSVTAIGEAAFENCGHLTSITLPNSLISIGKYAFKNCVELSSIILPNSLTSIGKSAFTWCFELTSITLPKSLSSIGRAVFFDCRSLTNIEVDGDNQSFSSTDGILYDKSQTTLICYPAKKAGDFTMPNSVSTIEDCAFFSCTGLTSITLSNSLTSIKDQAFCDCTGLTSITLPNTLSTIGYYAFQGCTGLSSITLPNSLTSLGQSVFKGCTSLTCIEVDGDNQSFSSIDGLLYDKSQTTLLCCPEAKTGDITLPNSVTRIECGAFDGCTGLSSITLPSSLTTIVVGSFTGCSGLTSITSLAVTPPQCTSDYVFRDGIDLQNCTLYVPEKSISAYQQSKGWSVFDHIEPVPDPNKFEVNGIFYRITDHTAKEVEVTYEKLYDQPTPSYTGNLEIPTSVSFNEEQYTVTAIGEYAFYRCTGLTSITLPASLTSIGSLAFNGCTAITSITLPESLTTIGSYAFMDCTGLTSIVIPNSVTFIDFGAFHGCSGLTSVTLPEFLTSIRGYTFYGCAALTSITLPESLTSIGDGAFQLCSGLTSINLPNSLTSIGEATFVDCSSLTSITLPNNVTSTGNNTFERCTSLTSVTMPETITYIGYRTFGGCTSLTSITVPKNVTTIIEYAFDGCTGLTSITSLAVTPPPCSSYTFSGIDTQNCTLYVPAESIEAYKEADGWKDFYCIAEVSGIDPIVVDSSAKVQVFNLNGTQVSDTLENLPAGIYIVREGTTVRKVAIR